MSKRLLVIPPKLRGEFLKVISVQIYHKIINVSIFIPNFPPCSCPVLFYHHLKLSCSLSRQGLFSLGSPYSWSCPPPPPGQTHTSKSCFSALNLRRSVSQRLLTMWTWVDYKPILPWPHIPPPPPYIVSPCPVDVIQAAANAIGASEQDLFFSTLPHQKAFPVGQQTLLNTW